MVLSSKFDFEQLKSNVVFKFDIGPLFVSDFIFDLCAQGEIDFSKFVDYFVIDKYSLGYYGNVSLANKIINELVFLSASSANSFTSKILRLLFTSFRGKPIVGKYSFQNAVFYVVTEMINTEEQWTLVLTDKEFFSNHKEIKVRHEVFFRSST